MGFFAYLKSSCWDFLLCALAASGLAYTVFSGFYASQPLQSAPWAIALACMAALMLLFCIAYRTTTAIAGSIAVVVVVGIAVVALQGTNPGVSPVDDVEGNFTIALLSFIVVVTGVFLLSRQVSGCVILLVLGVVVCAVVEYLYRYGHVLALAVFFAGAVGLLAFRYYQKGIADSDTERLSFSSVSIAALAMCAIALGFSFGVYKVVVEPLDPPGVEMKLIVEYRRAEEVEIAGTGAISAEFGGGQTEEQDEESQDEFTAPDTFPDNILYALGLTSEQIGNAGTATLLERIVKLALFAILALLLVIALVIVARKLVRRHQFRKMTEVPNEEAVRNLYGFFLSRFAKLKIPHPQDMTPLEYCGNYKTMFDQFEAAGNADAPNFGSVTDLFVRTSYGSERMADEQVEVCKQYYRAFYKRACSYVGRIKYLYKFFVL